jgi:hypothetical protein
MAWFSRRFTCLQALLKTKAAGCGHPALRTFYHRCAVEMGDIMPIKKEKLIDQITIDHNAKKTAKTETKPAETKQASTAAAQTTPAPSTAAAPAATAAPVTTTAAAAPAVKTTAAALTAPAAAAKEEKKKAAAAQTAVKNSSSASSHCSRGAWNTTAIPGGAQAAIPGCGVCCGSQG